MAQGERIYRNNPKPVIVDVWPVKKQFSRHRSVRHPFLHQVWTKSGAHVPTPRSTWFPTIKEEPKNTRLTREGKLIRNQTLLTSWGKESSLLRTEGKKHKNVCFLKVRPLRRQQSRKMDVNTNSCAVHTSHQGLLLDSVPHQLYSQQ